MTMRGLWMSFRLHRLQGYGPFEALVSMLAHRVCGTPMYWYPKARRDQEANSMTKRDPLTADELRARGERLRANGHDVVHLHPSEEWIAVETQTPFVRIGRIPTGSVGEQAAADGGKT
jgi:hypothetical protein